MNTNLRERIAELQDAIGNKTNWGPLIDFLDSINSVGELEEFIPILEESKYGYLINGYKEDLKRWEDPQLPAGFEEKCPLLTARLDTPQKIRILLRAADFRGINPLLIGEVFEDIIHAHEIDKKDLIYPWYPTDEQNRAVKTVYHTQIPAWAITKVSFPGARTGIDSGTGTFIDWRTEKERETAIKNIGSCR